MKKLLKNGSFQAFLWTQFLGALNDNLYKTVVSLHAVHVAAGSGGATYLAIAGAVFVIPFLLFSGYSGFLADRFSKRTILVSVKAFEIVVMMLGLVALFSDSITLMLVVLFLMALHSTVFSPAKYGIVPEMLREEDLSRANGLLEMTTFVAIVLGTSMSSFLYPMWSAEPWKLGALMIAVAVVGFATSFGIRNTGAAASYAPFRWNPMAEVTAGTKHLLADRPLWLTVVGISYFWMLGALFQMDLLLYGSETLKASDAQIGLMVTALAVGIGAGSLLAGALSGDRVELGLVPIGSFLMGVASMCLYLSSASYGWSVASLMVLGLASGLFIVPLNAFLQQRGERGEKGRTIATNNFYNTVGLLIASGVLWVLHDRLGLTPERVILGSGVLTVAATVYTLRLMPESLLRLIVRILFGSLYRIRTVHPERVPQKGAALLVANHVSLVDGFLVGLAAQHRRVRFMIWKPFYENWAFRPFLRALRAIPVDTNGPRGMVASLKAAKQELEAGHVVCIFAEGAITRTGSIQQFKRGMEKIVDGLDVPVIPVHLDRLWGSLFSFSGGKFFSKWPEQFPYPTTVSFGEPMPAASTANEVREAVMELSAEAVALRKEPGDTLPARFIRAARQNWTCLAMADSTGKELTFGKALTGAILVSDWLKKTRPEDKMVGLLLPSSVGAAVANLGVSLSGKAPVNLNFTTGKEGMAHAIKECGIRAVLTSKVFLHKAKIEAPEGAIYLEDLLKAPTGLQKAAALLRARFEPGSSLAPNCDPDSLATVIFSSGSTGVPKGVMLSHYNVLSNIRQMLEVYTITESDRIIGVLPFFHSFGFTVTLWLPMIKGCGALYHPNPLEAKAIGDLCQKYKGTFLLSTPTFCGTYVRKCSKEQFASLRYVLVGAEKLRDALRNEFREAFGMEMLEGYGATEMSPAVAVNAPDVKDGAEKQTGTKHGTVGRPLPGIAAKTVDPDSKQPLGVGQEGLLLVRGPNQMMGYLNQPERTASVLHEGWYITGDIASIDEDGFIKITDRLSRFSKVGGEMVPHVKIEEMVIEISGGAAAAVTGIPDERKGESLAVLYTAAGMSSDELWRRLSESELPKLWLPKKEHIHLVESLPVLGTGKLDLRGLRTRAIELSAEVVH